MIRLAESIDMVRGVLVDLGFGQLIDKFEERFGKTATTFILGLIGLSVTVFCIRLLIFDAAVPLFHIVRNWDWGTISGWIISNIMAAVVTFCILAMLLLGSTLLFASIFQRLFGKMVIDYFVKKENVKHNRERSAISDEIKD